MRQPDMQASFDPREFRSALGAFATGVTIVTARASDGTPIGVTANSFNSVSLNPPMILWSLARNSRSLAAFESADHWVVHILAADQEALSNRFAKSGEDKFAGLETEAGFGNAPLLKDCTCRLQCKTAFMYEGGDHVIFVGEVLAYDRREAPCLVFQAGKYALATRMAAPSLLSGNEPRESDISYGEDYLGYLLWRADLQYRRLVIPQLEAHGLDVDSFMILALLMHRNGRTLNRLASDMLLQSGPDGIAKRIGALTEQKLVTAKETADAGPAMWLTDKGREVALRVHAALVSLETDVLGKLDPAERIAIKHVLRSFIVCTDGGLPHPWQDAK
jgi:3-hydroxy-9,10-secoandrosta-1,3,5(10)-triene-9,17-dione monooxygenase reductase component